MFLRVHKVVGMPSINKQMDLSNFLSEKTFKRGENVKPLLVASRQEILILLTLLSQYWLGVIVPHACTWWWYRAHMAFKFKSLVPPYHGSLLPVSCGSKSLEPFKLVSHSGRHFLKEISCLENLLLMHKTTQVEGPQMIINFVYSSAIDNECCCDLNANCEKNLARSINSESWQLLQKNWLKWMNVDTKRWLRVKSFEIYGHFSPLNTQWRPSERSWTTWKLSFRNEIHLNSITRRFALIASVEPLNQT